MAVSFPGNKKLKVGIVDETNDRQTRERTQHSTEVAQTLAKYSNNQVERVYYGLTTNGNPPPIEKLATATKDNVYQITGQVVVGMLNGITDAVATYDKYHPDLPVITVPSGINKARLVKALAENNDGLGLKDNYQEAANIVDKAFEMNKAQIDAAKQRWYEKAASTDKLIVASGGNEGDYTDAKDPDAAQNMFVNDQVVGVSATNKQGLLEDYASRGSKIRYSAVGETDLHDAQGNPVKGSSFSAPIVGLLAAKWMAEENLTKDQVKKRLDENAKPTVVADAGNATSSGEGADPAMMQSMGGAENGTAGGLRQATQQETGKGFIDVAALYNADFKKSGSPTADMA